MKIVRKDEYPKPQFVRKKWINLNGEWSFEIDNARSGMERRFTNKAVQFTEKINVPFSPQSKLSGIGYTDFIRGLWYKRSFSLNDIPDERCVLHFGAVDYKAVVFVNEKRVGIHIGGYTSFEFDITDYVVSGENSLCVYVEDDERDDSIPTGKQSRVYQSRGCCYTRTTGIWQTVWLEFTPKKYVKWVKYYPDIKNCSVTIEVMTSSSGSLNALIEYQGRTVGEGSIKCLGGTNRQTIFLSEKHLWEIGNGRLYDVKLTFDEDIVESYFGLREVGFNGMKFMLNEKAVFQRLVLDQGFYPDGIYTSPNDAVLEKDIKLSMACGFNGARLHEKVFEERYLYHCDKLGYMVWAEFPDWGLNISNPSNIYVILPQWLEALNRDFNHPSIITWCPHNETFNSCDSKQCDESISLLYDITKLVDTTRPCVDASGAYHIKTDIFDVHDYEQDYCKLKNNYLKLVEENVLFDLHSGKQQYSGQPVMISEYGGIKWSNENSAAWGYGTAPKSQDEFYNRFERLADAIMSNKLISGFCYTQLYDIEQEQNGLYFYDRTPKFDCNRFYEIIQKTAAIEKED